MDTRNPRRLTTLRLDPLETRDNPASSFLAAGAAAGGLPLASLVRADGSTLATVQPFDSGFTGGVRAAAGELDGDPNTVELVVAAGPGGGPRVVVYSVNIASGTVSQIASFFAFEPSFTGGLRVAVGDVGGNDGRQEIVVGADLGGGPRVRTFDLDGAGGATTIAGPLGDFFAFEPGFQGGVRVAVGELDGNTNDGQEILLAAGPGGGPRVRVLRADGAELANFFAFRSDFFGGVNVAFDSSGGTVDVPRIDALATDFSQRFAALNSEALPTTNSNSGTSTNNTVTTNANSTNTTGLLTTTTGTSANGVVGNVTGTSIANPSGTPAVQLGTSGTNFNTTSGTGFGSTTTGTSEVNSTDFGLGTATGGLTGFGNTSVTAGSVGGVGFSGTASGLTGLNNTGTFGTSFGTGTTGGSSFTTGSTGSSFTGTGGTTTDLSTAGTGLGSFSTAAAGNTVSSLGSAASTVLTNGLSLGTNGLPVSFAGSNGSQVFASNPGLLTAFPTLLNPVFADGFTQMGSTSTTGTGTTTGTTSDTSTANGTGATTTGTTV